MSLSSNKNDFNSSSKEKEIYQHEKEIIEGVGVRHTLAFMGFCGLAFTYAFRVDLSVAIVAMVNHTQIENGKQNESLSDACPLPHNYDSNSTGQSMGEFNWDEKTQGIILGSYFYGYILTSVLGGLAAERFGGRLVLGMGVMSTAIFTIFSPLAARSSTTLFIILRSLVGCSSGVVLPAIHNMIPKWYPKIERSKFTTIIFSGIHIGTVLTLPISGWLSASEFLGGWPSIFYLIGGAGVIWALVWFSLITDDPKKHSRISDQELKYIVKGCPQLEDRQSVPWISILTSRYFWAISIMHFGSNWGFYTFLTELPTYLDQILHINITSNGILSALPYFGAWVTSIVFSLIMDQLLAKKITTIIFVRRISMALGGYGAMLFLLLMTIANCNTVMALSILIISGAFNGFVYTGFFCSHADISPRFAGTLMGMTNVFGTISGFGAPAVTGALTNNNQTLRAWKMVFLISAVIYAVTTTIYITLITADVQSWDNPLEKKKNKACSNTEEKDATISPSSFSYLNTEFIN